MSVVKRKAKNTAKKVGSAIATGQSLQQKTEEHLHAYLDSVMVCDRSQPLTGVPSMDVRASRKERGFTDFTFTSGTAGSGYAVFNPVTTNNAAVAGYSSSSTLYTGTTLQSTTAAPAGSTPGVNLANLPFANASLAGAALNARIVGFGVEFESTTANLTEQGVIQYFVDPEHEDISAYGTTQLAARSECVTVPIRKGVKHHFFIPAVLADDTNYSQNSNPYSANSGAPAAGALAGILVTGASAANPVTVLVRVTSIVEYVGSLVESNATPNPISAVGGAEHASQVANRMLSMKPRAHHLHAPVFASHAHRLLEGIRGVKVTMRKARNTANQLGDLASMAGFVA